MKIHPEVPLWLLFNNDVGAGKKTGISEIRYIDMDISKIDINRYIWW
jgi:hypothetical protein